MAVQNLNLKEVEMNKTQISSSVTRAEFQEINGHTWPVADAASGCRGKGSERGHSHHLRKSQGSHRGRGPTSASCRLRAIPGCGSKLSTPAQSVLLGRRDGGQPGPHLRARQGSANLLSPAAHRLGLLSTRSSSPEATVHQGLMARGWVCQPN